RKKPMRSDPRPAMLFDQVAHEAARSPVARLALDAFLADLAPAFDVRFELGGVHVVPPERVDRRAPERERAVVSSEPLRGNEDPAVRVTAERALLETEVLRRLPELVVDPPERGDAHGLFPEEIVNGHADGLQPGFPHRVTVAERLRRAHA